MAKTPGRRRLFLDQYHEIRAKLAAGQSQASLAREYGVAKVVIWKMAKRLPDGETLWLRNYRRDQERIARRNREREERGRLEPPEWTGEVIECPRHGLVKDPCIACWSAAHKDARDGHRYDDQDLPLEHNLHHDEEEIRKRLRQSS